MTDLVKNIENNERLYTMTTKTKQITMFGTNEFPTHEEIIESYSKEFNNYIAPKGDTIFGFWMQTIADLQLLDLELKGLTKKYKIDPIKRTVAFEGSDYILRYRIAHLDTVNGKHTLYSVIVDTFGDTNAYAFHNLYPYKGKFYPRVVRTLANAFNLDRNAKILDPFNGSGTATHEASLMGISSTGIDITPMGVMLAEIKNDLLYASKKDILFSINDLKDILHSVKKKTWKHSNPLIEKLMLCIYFDTVDAFARTSRYNRKGETGLFIEKFNYIKDCYDKLMLIKEKFNLQFKKANIIKGDILDLQLLEKIKEKFDAVITSPPYYFSIDYVGKDKIAYDYLGIDMKRVESKYLGMKESGSKIERSLNGLPPKVITYYGDLKQSIKNIFNLIKSGGFIGIIVGDSTVNSQKIPTTIMTKKFCEETGFEFQNLIFNPLLGARNRAIRGESIIICRKP